MSVLSPQLDKSTKVLATTTTSLTKVMDELQALVSQVPSIVLEIETKNAELALVESTNKEALRKAKAELSLKIIENKDAVLTSLMGEKDYAVITTADLETLKAKLVQNEEDAKADIAKAVNAAVANVKQTAEVESLKAKALWDVEKAQLTAATQAAEGKVAHLQAQVDSLQDTIAEERAARIQIAQAEAKRQGVTVNNGK